MRRSGALDLAPLAERLGHVFDDLAHLREALTHPSAHTAGRARAPNYQRLEFLGDRVLALVIAEMLIETFPRENEGALSRRLTELVRAETCAEVAAELGLGEFIVLGDGEAASGGRAKVAILGDVAEAVIGAIFRDAGFEPARTFVRRAWGPHMLRTRQDLRDSKTTLQEWVQARGRPTPAYRLLERRGLDHEPEFIVLVEVPGIGSAEGAGRSKRAAEQAAAAAMLVAQGIAAEHANG
jgi:ribonuclease-3